jgi:hypothetical protein
VPQVHHQPLQSHDQAPPGWTALTIPPQHQSQQRLLPPQQYQQQSQPIPLPQHYQQHQPQHYQQMAPPPPVYHIQQHQQPTQYPPLAPQQQVLYPPPPFQPVAPRECYTFDGMVHFPAPQPPAHPPAYPVVPQMAPPPQVWHEPTPPTPQHTPQHEHNYYCAPGYVSQLHVSQLHEAAPFSAYSSSSTGARKREYESPVNRQSPSPSSPSCSSSSSSSEGSGSEHSGQQQWESHDEQPATRASKRARSKRRVVVLDAANIAYNFGKDRAFCTSGIAAACDYYHDRGFEVCAVLGSRFRPGSGNKANVDDPERLMRWQRDGWLHFAPAGSYDDRFTLTFARDQDALVVTNDRFRDLAALGAENTVELASWIKGHVCQFMFIQDKFVGIAPAVAC